MPCPESGAYDRQEFLIFGTCSALRSRKHVWMRMYRAGKAAGCYVVAIPDSRFTEEEKAIFRKEADTVVDDLTHFNGEKFGIDLDMAWSFGNIT
jgi:hypothetical protein